MSTYHFTPNKASKTSKGTIPIVSKQNPSNNTKREIAKLYVEISAIENKIAMLKNKAESLKAQIQANEFMNDTLDTEPALMQAIYDVFKGRDDIIHLQPNGPDGIVAFVAGLESLGVDMDRLDDYEFEIVVTDTEESLHKYHNPCETCFDECEGIPNCSKYYTVNRNSENLKNESITSKGKEEKEESTLENTVSNTVKHVLNSPYLSVIEEYLNDMFPDRPPTSAEIRKLCKEWAEKCKLGRYCPDKTCDDCVLGPDT